VELRDVEASRHHRAVEQLNRDDAHLALDRVEPDPDDVLVAVDTVDEPLERVEKPPQSGVRVADAPGEPDQRTVLPVLVEVDRLEPLLRLLQLLLELLLG
jgi:plasmid stability protein